jgi:predicted DNA-binding transcriptional regulator AlpA
MSNGVPKFLRLKNLEERGIAKTHQAVRHMQTHHGFPVGRLLGPGTRVWTEDEINEWLASRPTEPSRQTKERVARSIDARKTSRQMLDEEAA